MKKKLCCFNVIGEIVWGFAGDDILCDVELWGEGDAMCRGEDEGEAGAENGGLWCGEGT